jgi:hypothetical protein
MHHTVSNLRLDTPGVNRVIRHAIANFDSRYEMYVGIHNGDTWDALASALLAYSFLR